MMKTDFLQECIYFWFRWLMVDRPYLISWWWCTFIWWTGYLYLREHFWFFSSCEKWEIVYFLICVRFWGWGSRILSFCLFGWDLLHGNLFLDLCFFLRLLWDRLVVLWNRAFLGILSSLFGNCSLGTFIVYLLGFGLFWIFLVCRNVTNRGFGESSLFFCFRGGIRSHFLGVFLCIRNLSLSLFCCWIPTARWFMKLVLSW